MLIIYVIHFLEGIIKKMINVGVSAEKIHYLMKLIFSEIFLFISLFGVFCSSLRLKIYNNGRIKMQKYFAYLLQILQMPVNHIQDGQSFFPALPAR